ncbi:hypothetical protein MMC12_008196 [Toensbergia leucococca]|nr:hypothetical protein [Toensbergia leucococca]
MAIPSVPCTPKNLNPPHFMRRAFTAPTRLIDFSQNNPKSSSPETEAVGTETLFAHHFAKIISFSPPSTAPRPPITSRRGQDGHEDEPAGTLPWASNIEETIAVGPLRIYKIPGSVAFLSSGKTLHPILAKSRCWCVDGESKFVLRIRLNAYYRIELPNNAADDSAKVIELKQVLAKVLQYETTPCPFKRGFTVDLPEPPKTPIRRRPWQPRRQSRPVAEQQSEDTETFDGYISTASDASSVDTTDISHIVESASNSGFTPRAIGQRSEEDLEKLKTPTRPKALGAWRAITAPPLLSLKTNPPSNLVNKIPQSSGDRSACVSLSSSVDSFHSFHSPISPLPPSPPYSDPPSPVSKLNDDLGLNLPQKSLHKRDVSDVTVTTNSPRPWDMTPTGGTGQDPALVSSPILPGTPALTNDATSQGDDLWPEVVTPPPLATFRRRGAPSRRRAHSPLPSPNNLYSPSSRMSGHHLTTAILQKTCSILLGPPVQLVALMLNIASKIAKGALRGSAFGYGEAGQKIPCSWDYSEADDEPEATWEEDDYGVSLGNLAGSRTMKAREVGGSWEID